MWPTLRHGTMMVGAAGDRPRETILVERLGGWTRLSSLMPDQRSDDRFRAARTAPGKCFGDEALVGAALPPTPSAA
jgi:hypothetical protein